MSGGRESLAYRHRSKKAPNWPLWIIMGVFALGIVGFLVQTQKSPTRVQSGKTKVRHVSPDGFCTDSTALKLNCCYCLSRDTLLCSECGQELTGEEAAKATTLAAGSQLGVIDAKWMKEVRWYHVQAVASDGKTALGNGWVSSTALKDQRLKLLQ